jgi:hypothetical protein
VPAIIKEAYTSFDSSNKVTMRFADECCFVFSIFTSLLLRENNATSAPEIVNVSSNKTPNETAKKVVPCVLIARK